MMSLGSIGSCYMCNYYKVIGTIPFCVHDCDGCMFHEEDEENDKERDE